MTYEMDCPRCGEQFEGTDRNAIADAVIEHARTQHNHALDRHVVLAHLEGVHPHEREQD